MRSTLGKLSYFCLIFPLNNTNNNNTAGKISADSYFYFWAFDMIRNHSNVVAYNWSKWLTTEKLK